MTRLASSGSVSVRAKAPVARSIVSVRSSTSILTSASVMPGRSARSSCRRSGRRRPGAARVGPGEPAQQVPQRRELVLAEPAEEQLPDGGQMGGPSLGDLRATLVGDDGVGAAGVVLARAAMNQAVALQTVDQAG